MPRVLPFVILALLVIFCVVEVAQADPNRVRLLPRWLWAACIILLPLVGAVGWLLFGRPVSRASNWPTRPPRGPDDDPDFLRRL